MASHIHYCCTGLAEYFVQHKDDHDADLRSVDVSSILHVSMSLGMSPLCIAT